MFSAIAHKTKFWSFTSKRFCVVCALNCARILVVRALDCAPFLFHPALFPTKLERRGPYLRHQKKRPVVDAALRARQILGGNEPVAEHADEVGEERSVVHVQEVDADERQEVALTQQLQHQLQHPDFAVFAPH